MDFFTVPTLTFRVLYCFFVIEHGRRKILHFNVTEQPTGPWIVQQLREAFPESCPYRYAILDRDSKFGEEVTDLLTASGMKPTRISPASPWQNGVAERWIGSCRRELLDHPIVLNDVHLRRLIPDYIIKRKPRLAKKPCRPLTMRHLADWRRDQAAISAHMNRAETEAHAAAKEWSQCAAWSRGY
jgi:transposase InsO family protein